MRRTNQFLMERRGAFDWKCRRSGKSFFKKLNPVDPAHPGNIERRKELAQISNRYQIQAHRGRQLFLSRIRADEFRRGQHFCGGTVENDWAAVTCWGVAFLKKVLS